MEPDNLHITDRTKPFISVVIPTYRRLRKLQCAVQSVLSQSYQDWELIVSDDEEPAGQSWHYVQSLAATDKRIKVIRNTFGHGQSSNTNNGILEARGDWVKFLHDDDTLLSSCLEDFAQVAVNVPENVVLISADGAAPEDHSSFRATRKSSMQIRTYCGDAVLYGMYLQDDVGGTVPSSIMMRRSLVHRGVLFENNRHIPTAIDSLFKAKALTQGDLVHIDKQLYVKSGANTSSITGSLDWHVLDSEFLILREIIAPLIAPRLHPPPLPVVKGQVILIRALHRLKYGFYREGFQMLLSVHNPQSWLLTMEWVTRRLFPSLCQRVKGEISLLS